MNESLIPAKERVEIDKWSYYLLKRSGFQEDAVLSLLQLNVDNRELLKHQYKEASDVELEEELFKNFLVSSRENSTRQSIDNSSTSFYSLMKEIK